MTKELKGKLLLFCAILVCQAALAQQEYECPCSEIGLDPQWADSSRVICYKIPVDQTLDKPENGKIFLAAIRAIKTGNSTLEPLLYLHGGPGIATLDNARRYLKDPDWISLRENHDIIMMDYRGTGFSEPSLCEDILDSLKSVERSALSREEIKQRSSQLILKCREFLPEKNIDLNSFSSFQIAADANAIRKAMGINTWNIYGISYGTLVAMMYLRHFPENLNKVVLDSPAPPNVPSFNFIYTMNESLQQIQSRVSENPKTANAFKNIKDDFATTAARLNTNPVRIHGYDFTGNDFAWAMVMSFYKTKIVHLIPLALKEFANGNDDLLVKWVNSLNSDSQYGKENRFQNMAIFCYECKPRTEEDQPRELEKKYPHLQALSGRDFLETCSIFRPEIPSPSFYEPIESNLPVLVLAGELDPGTPPSYAKSTIEKMPNATLAIVPNASHAAMHYNKCTLNLVKSFLESPENKMDSACLKDIKKMEFATANLEEELEKVVETHAE